MSSLKKTEKLASKVDSLNLGFWWKDRGDYSNKSGIQREPGRPGRWGQHDSPDQLSWSHHTLATWAHNPSGSLSSHLSLVGAGEGCGFSHGDLELTLAQMGLASTGFWLPFPSLAPPCLSPSHSPSLPSSSIPAMCKPSGGLCPYDSSIHPSYHFLIFIPISHTHRIGAC